MRRARFPKSVHFSLRRDSGVVIFLAITTFAQCNSSSPDSKLIFSRPPPQNEFFKEEVQYLEKKQRLIAPDRMKLEKNMDDVENQLGVPKALLWCVLFQESRLDAFKNAVGPSAAKGMGQFTQNALSEINDDTDHYDVRTGKMLGSVLVPKGLPIDFSLKLRPRVKREGYRTKQLPDQLSTSYFNAQTAVFASGAYLNNRYQQLRRALDRQGVTYDPEVLWLYAAAAYNKGSRTVFVLLTQLYMNKGEKGLSDLLTDAHQSLALLTHEELLNSSLRDLWRKRTRVKYLDELSRNMELISSCVNPEIHL